MKDLKKLTELSRRDLVEYYGLEMSVDVGNDFFNALIYGTLKSLVERVDSSGFCQTSYGEENGIKCYEQSHYPRDTAENANVLAKWGFFDHAVRILDFTLRNIPEGQYYIPHVYRPDGSIKANTIQVDTPAHLVLALARLVELQGATDTLARYFNRLDALLDGVWQHHYHPEWCLLDAGNYNEQVEGDGTICDLFTNCSIVAAMSAMTAMAKTFNRTNLKDKYQDRHDKLVSGIEKTLFDPARNIYRVKIDLPSGKDSAQINWVNLYCRRWYEGNAGAWDSILDVLARETNICWDGMDVISGFRTREGILGKFFGHLLAFLAQTGRFELLDRHLPFAEKTINRPINLYPEVWYFQEPEKFTDYQVGFWKIYGGIWEPYKSNPNGDYTIDSGNCEQSAVFIGHFTNDLLGLTTTNGVLNLCPKLPFRFNSINVQNAPIRFSNGKLQRVSYELHRQADQLDLLVNKPADLQATTAVMLRKNSQWTVSVNKDRSAKYTLCDKREVTCMKVDSLPQEKNIVSIKPA